MIVVEQVLEATPYKASITKTIKVRRTRHAGHCWRSRDELISDILLWTPTYGRAKVGRPAWTYIQQLCEDTGCWPEDLPEAMNDWEKWRERVRDIRAGDRTWWWWYIWLNNKDTFCLYNFIRILSSGNLLRFLLRLGTRLYDLSTQWDSNSPVKVC